MSELAESIRLLASERGVSEDSVKTIIESTLKAAYKKTYGTDINAIVKFEDDLSEVNIYSRKVVVDGVYDPVTEIELEEARRMSDEVEEGDEVDIWEDPKAFDVAAVRSGKQRAHEDLKEGLTRSLYNEYKGKVGKLVVAYDQFERNGDIFCDLGNAGKVEGRLPVRNQSPRERYEKGDRIKALVVDLKEIPTGLQVVLSRSDPKLVRAILEMEVPEIGDGTVQVYKIVRDPGNRTKIAVWSEREDVDPVGACVGLKGVRIQNVIRELLGERIDVLKWDKDVRQFIKNALSPAQVRRVVILDGEKRRALAIVDTGQLSLAIGKGGQNVRLANKLCDWTIDVKTEAETAGMDLSEDDAGVVTGADWPQKVTGSDVDEGVSTAQSAASGAARALFSDDVSDMGKSIADLSGVDERTQAILKEGGIEYVEQFIEAKDNGALKGITALTRDAIALVNAAVERDAKTKASEELRTSENAENADDEAEGQYRCPECGAIITEDMTRCPVCGVEFEFEDDEE